MKLPKGCKCDPGEWARYAGWCALRGETVKTKVCAKFRDDGERGCDDGERGCERCYHLAACHKPR
jgi:hypothetical protein